MVRVTRAARLGPAPRPGPGPGPGAGAGAAGPFLPAAGPARSARAVAGLLAVGCGLVRAAGAGVVHLPGRRRLGQAQLEGQLVGGELPGQRAAGVPGGELGDRGQLRPLGPRRQPSGRGHDTQQLVIRAPGQPAAARAGDRLHHRGQQRARRHRVGLPILGEPGQRHLPRRPAHVQALPGRAFPVIPGTGPLSFGRQRGAAGLLAVWPGFGERVLDH